MNLNKTRVKEKGEVNIQALDDGSYVLRRPIPLNFGPDLQHVRDSDQGGKLEMAYFAIVASGYPSNPRDPIVGV